MLHKLSREFSRSSLSLRCREEETVLFTKSQWSDSTKWFLVYRISIWLYQVCWSSAYLIYLHMYHPDRLNRNHRYFTSWGDFINNAYYSSALALCIVSALRNQSNTEESKSVKNIRSFTWLLHTIAINSSVIVSMMFWMLVSSKFNSQKLQSVFNIHRHAVSSFVMIIDFCVIATPVRLLHVVYAYLYGLMYMFGTLVMYWSGDTAEVYAFLNWATHPGKAAMVAVLIAAIVPTVLQFVFFMLNIAKKRLVRCSSIDNDTRNSLGNNVQYHMPRLSSTTSVTSI